MPINTIKRIKSRYAPRGSFAANVMTIMTGTTIAQAIPIIISPILTRVYAPEDFGGFALFMSIVGIMSTGATGAYEQAIMLPKKDDKSANIVALCLCIAFVQAIILFVIICLFNNSFSNLLKNAHITPWLYSVPLLLLLTGSYQAFTFWSNRRKEYSRLALNRIFQSFITATMNLSMGIWGWGTTGLIGGYIVGQSVSTCVLGWQQRNDYDALKENISRKNMADLAREYSVFPKFCLPQTLLDGARDHGLVFIISYFFNLSVIGYFNFASRILRIPLNLIGSSLAQVFYQRATQIHNSGNSIWPILRKLIVKLVSISLPICICMITWGPQLFRFVFGAKWEVAGEYAQILTPWLMINFIGSSISQTPVILGKQKQFLVFGVIFNVSLPGTFIAAALATNDIKKILIIVSVTASLLLLSSIAWIIKIALEYKPAKQT